MTEHTQTIFDYYSNVANMVDLTTRYAIQAQTEFYRLANEQRLARLDFYKANWDAYNKFCREMALDVWHLRKGA